MTYTPRTNRQRSRNTLHASARGRMDQSCKVDGGNGRHGVRGFTCPRCAEQDDDVEAGLLIKLEALARAVR